jgi:hypothetical protein
MSGSMRTRRALLRMLAALVPASWVAWARRSDHVYFGSGRGAGKTWTGMEGIVTSRSAVGDESTVDMRDVDLGASKPITVETWIHPGKNHYILPGEGPCEVVLSITIGDRQYHHLAMTTEKKVHGISTVNIYIDGERRAKGYVR